MAVGDVVSAIETIGTGAYMTVQPAAGVVYMIFGIGSDAIVNASPNGVPNVTVFLYDGTNYSTLWNSNSAQYKTDRRIVINNTRYLMILNGHGSNANLSYYGIQIQ